MTRRPILTLGITAFTVLLAACQDETSAPKPPGVPRFSVEATEESPAKQISRFLDETNAALAAAGANIRAVKVEYITHAGSHEAGAEIIQKDVGNKRLEEDFVPFDPRRTWSGPNGEITYAIDQTTDAVPPSGLPASETTAAIQRAMATWAAVKCSDLELIQNPDFGLDIGVLAFQLSGGLVGTPFIFADIHHAGWRDLDFAGGTLAATVTFVFVDEDGNVTDINGDGKDDVAFREIYYDPSWIWNIDGDVDVETIALHEAGHGLSQAHFGNIMIKNDGTLKAAPRAVMNALYFVPLQQLQGSDNGGHCSIWANWPRR